MENNQNENINLEPSETEVVGNAVTYSVLAYIGIFWLIGLLASPEKDTAFVKNHVNNGIVLSIIDIAASIVVAIPVLGWIVSPILYIAVLVFRIMGIVAAAKKEFFTIPLIGDKFQIIK